MAEFQSFSKIPRFYRDIVITEKIDGTNAQILIPENPEEAIQAGSRNRWITPEDDNFGFDTKTIDQVLEDLKASGSRAVPGWMQPEGVIIYHCQSRQMYKYTIDDADGTERTKPKNRGPQDLPPGQSAYTSGNAPL